jgi:endogenous inhibitor of DNA gyrase (YacG/DUF329 family)
MVQSRACPICKRPFEEGEATRRFRPFCSKRCADIDLGRWLRGTYAIPAVEADEAETETSSEPADEGGTSSRIRQ